MINTFERVALDQYLSSYPVGWEFNRILDGIEDEEQDIVIWAPFQDWVRGDIVQLIDDTKFILERNFVPKVQA